MIRWIFGLILMGLGVWLLVLPLPTAMSGLCLFGFGFLFVAHWFVEKRKWKKGWRIAIWSVGVGVFASLSIAIAAITFQGKSQWEQARQGNYAVVMGSQIWGDRPSLILQQRLDASLQFMRENPHAIVIVTGGQGADEIMPEAEVMEDYLLTHGGDASRIFVEDQAKNTRENLIFSAEIAESQGLDAQYPVIITSEFHMARSKYIARSLDMIPFGVSSKTNPFHTKVNALVREVFAFIKAWAVAGSA